MIDLHLHTTASDGALSPAELLKKAEGLGLQMISVTDHFTVKGYKELKDPAVRSLYSGKLLPGCEYSAHYKDLSIEILGFGIRIDDAAPFLEKRYGTTLQEKWAIELDKMMEHYRSKGYPFDERAVREHFAKEGNSARFCMTKELFAHPENRQRLLYPEAAENGSVFLRKEYSNPESAYFFPAHFLHAEAKEVCDEIHRLGGLAVLAHPLKYNPAFERVLEEMLREVPLDGLEAWYGSNTAEQREYLLQLCRKYDLIYSGGSDFHNPKRENSGGVKMGMAHLKDVFPTQTILEFFKDLPTL